MKLKMINLDEALSAAQVQQYEKQFNKVDPNNEEAILDLIKKFIKDATGLTEANYDSAFPRRLGADIIFKYGSCNPRINKKLAIVLNYAAKNKELHTGLIDLLDEFEPEDPALKYSKIFLDPKLYTNAAEYEDIAEVIDQYADQRFNDSIVAFVDPKNQKINKEKRAELARVLVMPVAELWPYLENANKFKKFIFFKDGEFRDIKQIRQIANIIAGYSVPTRKAASTPTFDFDEVEKTVREDNKAVELKTFINSLLESDPRLAKDKDRVLKIEQAILDIIG